MTMNFVDELLLLINKVIKSTHEDQVIGDVTRFIEDLLNARESKQLRMTYEFYNLYDNLLNEISFKHYIKVLEIFYKSELRSHKEVGMRFDAATVFAFACNNNLFDVVQWAFTRCDAFQDNYLSDRYCRSLIFACSSGYLEIAQFLLENLRKRFNAKFIETNVLECFKGACKNGRSNVVEWLLSLEFNFEYSSDFVNIVCDKHFIEVLDLLIRFRPYKLNIVFNAERTRVISYEINSLQEEKWLQRKLPLLAHNDNENVTIFNSIPQEMVQYICQFV
jgi:hypothetical protein